MTREQALSEVIEILRGERKRPLPVNGAAIYILAEFRKAKPQGEPIQGFKP
jgi:hypothetical protein